MVDRLSTFLRAAVQVDSDDRTYARFIASSVFDSFRNPQFQGRAQGQLNDVRRFVADSLVAEAAKGGLRPDVDVEAVTEMLVALMWGISMYAGFLGTHQQLESVVDQMVRLVSGDAVVSRPWDVVSETSGYTRTVMRCGWPSSDAAAAAGRSGTVSCSRRRFGGQVGRAGR
jgi:hypothetical protein